MKKILCLMLIISVITSFMPVYASDVLGVMEGLELISGDENEQISREEFLKTLLEVRGVKEEYYAKAANQLFFDVPVSSKNADMAATAFSLGIVSGGSDGLLHLSDKVKWNDAIVMIVRSLGLEKVAQMHGGYPDGYLYIGNSFGLGKGITLSGDTLLRGDMAKLFYNLVNVRNDKLPKEFASSKTNKFYTYRGIVETTSNGSIYDGNGIKEGGIIIDGKFYYTDVSYEEYLGHKVCIYYTIDKEDNRHIIHLSPESESFTIHSEDMASYYPGIIHYYDAEHDKDFEKKISKNAITTVNGVRTSVLSQGFDIPAYAYFELIDNDNDEVYDVVNVDEYELFAVKTYDSKYNIIYNLNDRSNNIEIADYKKYSVFKDGEEAAVLTDIKKDALLEVRRYGKDNLKINICTKTAYMDVYIIESEKTLSNKDYKVFIDAEGTKLYTTADFDKLNSVYEVNIGNGYNFKLDSRGRVALVLNAADEAPYTYAYLYMYGRESGLSDTVYFKFYTQNGEFETIKAGKTVKVINEDRNKDSKQLVTEITNPQLVRISKKADGTLKTIEFSDDTKQEGLHSAGTVPASGDDIRNRYQKVVSSIGGQIGLDDNTVVMVVPPVEDAANEEKYSIKNKDYFISDQYYYPLEAYLAGTQKYTADVILVPFRNEKIERESPHLIITDIIDYYDKETMQTEKRIKGYQDGALVAYSVRNGVECAYTPKNGSKIMLSEGDVIRFSLDIHGKISIIKLLMDADELKIYGVNDGDDSNVKIGQETFQSLGKIYDIKGNFFKMIRNGSTQPSTDLYPINNYTKYYEYDKNTHKDKVKVITVNDLQTVADNPNTTDNVFVFMKFANNYMVVVYK